MVGTRGSIAVLLAALAAAPCARAGGGPENVFLVVNSASWASQAVANQFIELRQISPQNVGYLNWTGGCETVDGDAFRQQILAPVFDLIKRRGLLSQIDYIIYSSDFPYAIDLVKDFASEGFIDQARPICSINSATFLAHFVLAKSAGMMDFHSNRYMRGAQGREVDPPTHAFRSWYGWGAAGELGEAGGQPYLLSTMLAMTSGRGNSVREAINYLRSSAGADGTHPKGTIYFSKTADVRSTTRSEGFDLAVAELKKLDVAAQVITTVLPVSRDDVQGLMTGAADLSWSRSRSTIRPGAICDNFTSYGGIMTEVAAQTPLSEFLRYGAAGASGTVVEPYAINVKFPSPLVHVHYARGCTLAESFYQSLFCPAQMLIVGDPLCRPWADIPKVQVGGVPADGKVSGTLSLVPQAKSPKGTKIDQYQLFVDGRLMGTTLGGDRLRWDSTAEADGYHELRVVAIEAGPIQSQGRAIFGVTANNHRHTAQLATQPAKTARWGEPVKVRAAAPGMAEIFVACNSRVLGKISGASGEFEFDPRTLGTGPVTLQALGTTGGESGGQIANRVWSAPVRLEIEPGKPLPPLPSPPANLVRGLALKLPDGKVVPIQDTLDAAWLTLAGMRAEQPFVLQGFVNIPEEDVYQFQVFHTGDLRLSLDGKTLYEGRQGDNAQQFVATPLAPGWHRLTASGKTASDLKLRILFGGPGVSALNGRTFRHAR